MIYLTSTQGDVLAFVRESCAMGVEPCVADIAVASGLSYGTVCRTIRTLYTSGVLTRRRDTVTDSFVYSPSTTLEIDDIDVSPVYHATQRETALTPPHTGIAICQAPIEFLPMRMR